MGPGLGFRSVERRALLAIGVSKRTAPSGRERHGNEASATASERAGPAARLTFPPQFSLSDRSSEHQRTLKLTEQQVCFSVPRTGTGQASRLNLGRLLRNSDGLAVIGGSPRNLQIVICRRSWKVPKGRLRRKRKRPVTLNQSIFGCRTLPIRTTARHYRRSLPLRGLSRIVGRSRSADLAATQLKLRRGRRIPQKHAKIQPRRLASPLVAPRTHLLFGQFKWPYGGSMIDLTARNLRRKVRRAAGPARSARCEPRLVSVPFNEPLGAVSSKRDASRRERSTERKARPGP